MFALRPERNLRACFLPVCCECFTENITIIPFFVLLPCRKCGERCNFAVILKTMKTMWFVLFFVLPFVGLAYVLWHVWCLLPLSAGWRWAVVGVGLAAFLTLFLNFSRAIDGLPSIWLRHVTRWATPPYSSFFISSSPFCCSTSGGSFTSCRAHGSFPTGLRPQ